VSDSTAVARPQPTAGMASVAQVKQPPPNIYQRINAVRKVAGYAKKDKKVDTYKAVTHDAITALLRQHLIEHGIVVVPRLRDSDVSEAGSTAKGTVVIRYAARYDIDFVNADSPDDLITIPVEAHANDYGDKAPGKALSYATKYAMLKVFSIETGEADEARVTAYAAETPQAEQQPVIGPKKKREYIEQLLEAVQSQDAPGLLQLWDEMENEVIEVLWRDLRSYERSAIKKLLAEARQAVDPNYIAPLSGDKDE
jgi:hypothetical protein